MKTMYKNLQEKYSIIYSTFSSLYLQGLINEPDDIYISVDSNYHNKALKLYKVTFVRRKYLYLGIKNINGLIIYDIERCIVDLIINRKKFGNDLVIDIIKNISFNYDLVMFYAKIMGLDKKVKAFLAIFQDFNE